MVQEKDILLERVDEVLLQRDENINLSLVVSVASTIMVVLFLFVPKIYLSNNIYKTSVDINTLKSKYLSLKNENNILKRKISLLKFHNGVTH
jgi:cell division protein FtsL